MIVVLQRVAHASVTVDDKVIGEITRGILVLLGVERGDTESNADRMLERILNYRIFVDSEDRMNLSLTDIQGGLLLVPQFTIAADTKKGMRPSFTPAAEPEIGKALFHYFVAQAKAIYPIVETGRFGADMQVELCNDGPATFILKTN
ncbi:MAG: D-tyrosyl-tRNA(Tyr) deacylase [Gammaproteobacteria bacterium GWE2_42_36]|nr:MAG: D-tyrosyl-tRNA(Tyr) deacylase [Gammaproteobacteria bacterium GWE2_42_36]HCU05374.1 D-tyrosyl-tRNA(Tyr) deacylase [Coxiellaceae bacterium]